MFRKKTTFVIGAGASCELGLPSGDQLKGKIVELLSPTRDNGYGFSSEAMQQAMSRILRLKHSDNWSELHIYRDAANKIRRGLPLAMSIDNFMHTHQHDPDVVSVGKLAIGLSILHAERRSHLFGSNISSWMYDDYERMPNLESEDLAASWYPSFAKILMSQVQVANVREAFSNVRFIIFNYDRCFEHYLWLALQDYFDISAAAAAEALEEVEFLHPYGSLGPLPWQSATGETIELGAAKADDPWLFTQQIRTFTESVADADAGAIKDAISKAEIIVVLGFGYLDQNVQLLKPSSPPSATTILSTAYNVSHYDQEVMKDQIGAWAKNHGTYVVTQAGSCRALFDNFHLKLNLG